LRRNRLLAKQLFVPTDEDNNDVHTPFLIPVFDPHFTACSFTPSDVATLTTHPTPIPHKNDNDMIHLEDPPSTSVQFSCTDDEFEAAEFGEWSSWSAQRRVAAVCRWISHACHRYGPMERWVDDFVEEWSVLRQGDAPAWLDKIKQRNKMTWKALSYLE
jgi:hypothetical protein